MARSAHLPRRLPAGTKYVVEGRSGAKGLFQVSARYVVLPNGRRLDLPAKVTSGSRAPSAAFAGAWAWGTGGPAGRLNQ